MRSRHWLLVGVGVLAILVCLLWLFRRYAGEFVVHRALAGVGRSLNCEVVYDSVAGDLFGRPRLHGLRIVAESESVRVANLRFQYDIVSLVLGKLSLSDVQVTRPQVFVSSASKAASPTRRVPAEKLKFPTLAIGRAQVVDGQFFLDGTLRADSITLALTLASTPEALNAGLLSARFWLSRESVGIRNIKAWARLTADSLVIGQLAVTTRLSRLQGDMRLALSGGLRAEFSNTVVSLPEFTDLPGKLMLNGSGILDSGDVTAGLAFAAEGVKWQEVVLPRIEGRADLEDSVLVFSARGSDSALGTMEVEASLGIPDVRYRGTARCQGVVLRRFEPRLPDVRFDATARVAGRGSDSIGVDVVARPADIGIDSLSLRGVYERGSLILEELELAGPAGRLWMDGTILGRTLSARCMLESLDLSLANRLAGAPVSGRASGLLRAEGRAESLSVSAGFRVRELSIADFQAGQAVVDVGATAGHALSGRVMAGAESIKVGGESFDAAQLVWSDPEFELRLDRPGAWLVATGDLGVTRRSVDALVRQLTVAALGETLTSTRAFTFSLVGDSLQLDSAGLAVAGGTAMVGATVRGRSPALVQIDVRGVGLARLRQLLSLEPDLSGTLDFTISGRDTFVVDLACAGLKSTMIGLDIASVSGRLRATDRQLDVEQLRLVRRDSSGAESASELAGAVYYDLTERPVVPRFDLEVDLRDPGVWAFAFLTPVAEIQEAQAYAQLKVKGTLQDPALSGRIRIARGKVYIPAINATVERVNAEMVCSGDKLKFEKLSGRSNRGTVVGSGFVDLGHELLVDSLRLDIQFTGAAANPLPEIYAVGDGNLTLEWASGEPLSVTVDAEASEALVAIDFGEKPRAPTGEETLAVFDIRVKGEREIWLRNPMADVELTGEIALRKTLTEEVYNGELVSRQGNVYYLDQTLRVTEGKVTFKNIDRLNPDLDITAELPVRRNGASDSIPGKVILNLTGTLEQPNISLRSEPPLWTNEDIVAYMSLNVTPGQLSQLEQKDAVTKLLSQRLLSYFQTQVSKRARGVASLDYLEFESGLLGGTGAKVTVGKYVGRNLYVSYTQTFTGDMIPAFRAEYYLNRRNELVAGLSEEGRYSLSYRFKLRY